MLNEDDVLYPELVLKYSMESRNASPLSMKIKCKYVPSEIVHTSGILQHLFKV